MSRRLQYQDIMLSLLELIGKLNLEVGDKLPSQRELCRHFGQSMITIRRAIQELENDGFLRAEAGKGVFIEKDIRKNRQKKAILLLDIGRGANQAVIHPAELNRAKNEINRNGYEFQMLACDDDPNDYVVKEVARSVGVFATGILNSNWQAFLRSLNIPVVVVGAGNKKVEKVKTVYRDARDDVVNALDYFTEKGMTKIGFLNAAKSYCWAGKMMSAYKNRLKKRGIVYSDDIVAMLEDENRYIETCRFLAENSAHMDCLLVESGIYPILLEAVFINQSLVDVPVAIVGGMSKMIHANSPKLVQFGPVKSTFQVALEVLYDQLQCPEKQIYKDDVIKIASTKIDCLD